MGNARILITEDESIVAMDIKMRLLALGYTVVGLAATGEQAIQTARQTQPDLVLMDIKIKGPMDGIETAERIRLEQNVPVIFLTAFADEPTLQRAKVIGPSGYILKPFNERELSIAIDMALYKHQMEKALRESEERYMLAIKGANDGIWDWDLKRNVLYLSPRWKEIIGYKEDEIGSSQEEWMRYVHPEDRERLQLAWDHHLDGLSDHLECEIRMLHKDGSIRWVLTRGLAVYDDAHRPERVAGSISDITALKRAQEQLVYDAYHDALTGIPNRALFLDRLEIAMRRRKRSPKDSLAVLFLDLDQFKVINDSLGHLAGDKMLVEIAQRLQNLVRTSDTVARLGGDEFVILLESSNGATYACNVAERIQELLRFPIRIEDHELTTSVSIGIVIINNDHQRPSDVLRDADIAMYRAKALGKGRHEVFEPYLSRQAVERLDIENRLIGALERKEFRLHFQPIYSFPNRKLVALEALLRLYPQGLPVIPPHVFIPVAEEIGLINEIGDWVLLESCQKMSEWHQRFPHESNLDLHINISIKQLRSPDFVNRLQEILEITHFKATNLKLEFTDRVFSENIQHISPVLDQLALLGIELLIDNFIIGNSSLGFIRRFPIHTIKLDRNFIFPLEGDDKNAEVVRAVLSLAEQLGLETVAEGIETEEQAGYMIDMKCRFGQGFLFSRPLDMLTIEELLKNDEIEV